MKDARQTYPLREERTSIFPPLLLTGYLVLFAFVGVETEGAFG